MTLEPFILTEISSFVDFSIGVLLSNVLCLFYLSFLMSYLPETDAFLTAKELTKEAYGSP